MTPKTRYTLYVPHHNNAGAPIPHVHTAVREELSHEFGGFTIIDALGEWRGNTEPITLYVVDTPTYDAWSTARDPYQVLSALARRVRWQADQEAVYLTRQEIETELI